MPTTEYIGGLVNLWCSRLLKKLHVFINVQWMEMVSRQYAEPIQQTCYEDKSMILQRVIYP